MKDTYTKEEVREMVMNYPDGSAAKKRAFLEHAGIVVENKKRQFIVTVSSDDKDGHESAKYSINLHGIIRDGIKASTFAEGYGWELHGVQDV